jgi:hypothetical protein
VVRERSGKDEELVELFGAEMQGELVSCVRDWLGDGYR